ncbi:TIGR03862 family flavoprotein [Ensifer adhaerens]|uniref:TIGR03862 family flavoprotein n=1 Tax=Ensifer adhaerens TaxID=106592 RepID=UPI001CBD7117|nr:TIGR03862 family flavoprotein [Ensifer adhaerens]MBZ7925137.1 TIGR03862 family flavoprotein [Ensifer adhaerens]UAX95678.1 TIGR03862 family flavoprotein [Ensifer adhaerens]UAY02430.1 TIGR03862 family flavoprotein [Ensifer adhaerens]UAY10413.1 TIGR03862 family flavoprotein [Ensifer adhaerens]
MGQKNIAIVGGGPSGLMAAQVLAERGHAVTVYDGMPTVARKFLLAGKSGLNITHSEPYAAFAERFGNASPRLRAALDAFTPDDIRQWAADLGTRTFVGSSGRVFPEVMKASPLLRAWLKSLESRGVRILTRHRWTGFEGSALAFETPDGKTLVSVNATLLALGGASYPRLGSDAAWVSWLEKRGVSVAKFQPANCGFDVDWSEPFRDRFAGAALKGVTATSEAGTVPGEFVVSKSGIEGSLVYAHTSALRNRLSQGEPAELAVDLAPGRTVEKLAKDLGRFDSKTSFSNRLRKGAGLEGVKAAVLRELSPDAARLAPPDLAALIKALPIPVLRPRPIAEAISSAGGVTWAALDDSYMLKALPGTFIAGEMIDWEAPTGGYLLTACFGTGRAAARGIDRWLGQSA